MNASGLVHTMDELALDFELDPNISRFDDSVCLDDAKKSFDCDTGKLMGVPINPNIQMLYYRSDLYEEHDVKVPVTSLVEPIKTSIVESCSWRCPEARRGA